MIVLDTNVISALMRPSLNPKVVEWLDRQEMDEVWTTAITVFEVHYGLWLTPSAAKRKVLEDAFARVKRDDLQDRICPIDESSVEDAAEIAARTRRAGKPVEMRDVFIAGFVQSRDAILATRNLKHFEHAGVRLLKPWASATP